MSKLQFFSQITTVWAFLHSEELYTQLWQSRITLCLDFLEAEVRGDDGGVFYLSVNHLSD